ncbi:MAG TPA: serine hydrolase [Frankiaceae bacterium]|jgi:D-alanyl-D-alanine carboxypeptidase (penicillin-binding protein 5/6)|nr:serine hydrolase [Frankiaceae bacterium]
MGAAGLRLRAAAVAVVASLAVVAPAAAPAYAEPPDAVGGPALAAKGIVVDRGAPPLPHVSAAGWLLADAGSGEVLAARNPHGRYLPASTLKTLTAVALLPEADLDATYDPTWEDVNIEGSKVGLTQGTRVSVGKLIEAMLVVSGNDAANAVANATGGLPAAVAKMNATAKRLQAYDTLARNPSGLDAPDQLTSPYDLALIARAGLSMPTFATYVSTLRSRMPAPGGKTFEMYNHNKLLTRYPGNIGIKTGYTLKARKTYVGAARRNGRTLVVTLLKAETSYPDATALLDWGFANAGRVTPVGRLVDPLAEAQAPEERADRSRVEPLAAPPAPVRVATPREEDGGPPFVPIGSGVAVVALVTLRVRASRRRYRPTLRLPSA